MTKQEWDALAKQDKGEYLKQYNEQNYKNCADCSENIEADSSFEYLLPCSQYKTVGWCATATV